MSIDIFGRSLKNGVGVSGPPGPRGQGFKITTDGQYDIENRRLCNVDNPISVNDAATVQFVQKELSVMYNSFMTEQSEVISHLHSQVVMLETSFNSLKKENEELKVIIKRQKHKKELIT